MQQSNDSITMQIKEFKSPLIRAWLNGKNKSTVQFHCNICDPKPDAKLEDCNKWPGFYMGCAKRDGNNIYPDFNCDGTGILTLKEPL